MPAVTTWKDLLRPGEAASFFDREPLPAFDASARAYSPANAWWLAELCRLVYRHDIEEEATPPRPTRVSFLARVGLAQIAFFHSERTSTQAFLVRSSAGSLFAALVFRGTEQDIRDFRTDLETRRIEGLGDKVLVHQGFEKALDAVWPGILTELTKLDCPVFFAGHSLGAALATLAALRRLPQAVYAFGSPRVGNERFAAALRAAAVYRVVDDADVIAELPLEAMGFRHAGQLHVLHPLPEEEGGFPLPRWPRSLIGPPKFLADHAPINYVRRVDPPGV